MLFVLKVTLYYIFSHANTIKHQPLIPSNLHRQYHKEPPPINDKASQHLMDACTTRVVHVHIS